MARVIVVNIRAKILLLSSKKLNAKPYGKKKRVFLDDQDKNVKPPQ